MKKLMSIFLLIITSIGFLSFCPKCFAQDDRYKISNFKNQIDKDMNNLLKKYNIPGVSIGIVEKDKVEGIYNYGFSDKKSNKLVNDDTIFQVGSISKSITAWAIMKLVQDGKIDLDAPAEKYLSRWKFPQSKFNSKDITIRRLLSHTAGLSVRGYSGYLIDKNIPTIEESLSGKNNSAYKIKIINKPGGVFKYSGGGYTVLQLIIEEVTGMKFEDYMKKEILEPLKMYNSSFKMNNKQSKNNAKPYNIWGNNIPSYVYTEKAAAGLNSTSKDLCEFLIAGMKGLTTNDKLLVLNKENIKLLYTPIKDGYGFGHAIADIFGKNKLITHSGANRGWNSVFAMLPYKEAGIVIITNSDNGTKLIKDILNLWIKTKTGKYLEMYYNTKKIENIINTICMTLLILLVLYSLIFILRLKKKERVFLNRVSYKSSLRKITRIILPIIISVTWWVLLYAPIFNGWSAAIVMPYGINRITYLITCWCFMFVITGIFPKTKNISLKNKLNANGGLK